MDLNQLDRLRIYMVVYTHLYLISVMLLSACYIDLSLAQTYNTLVPMLQGFATILTTTKVAREREGNNNVAKK